MTLKPKEFQRDLHSELQWPTLSWSMINCWQYSPEQWYTQYYKGIRSKTNSAMEIGIEVGEKLILDKNFLPEVKRYDTMEKKLMVKFSDITLKGHIDTFDSKTKNFAEYKTSLSKSRWTQKIAEDHGQLLFYFLLIYITYKIPPEKIKCHLYFIHCEESGDFSFLEGQVQCFEVKKKLIDIVNFSVFIKKTYTDMIAFIEKKSIIK